MIDDELNAFKNPALHTFCEQATLWMSSHLTLLGTLKAAENVRYRFKSSD